MLNRRPSWEKFEEEVAEILIADGWKVLRDVYAKGNLGISQCDIVAISETGILCVEVKNWSGNMLRLERKDKVCRIYNFGDPVYNVPNPLTQNYRQAVNIHTMMLRKGLHTSVGYIHRPFYMTVVGKVRNFDKFSDSELDHIMSIKSFRDMTRHGTQPVYTKEQVDEIYNFWLRFVDPSDERAEKHTRYLEDETGYKGHNRQLHVYTPFSELTYSR